MRLNEMQARFRDTMLERAPADDNFMALFDKGGVALTERLRIYRNNIMSNVSSAVVADFPMIEKLVGKDFMTAMARQYVIAHPPVNGCLAHYGDRFDDFIESYESAKGLPYLPDVARLEIAMSAAAQARDDEALAPEDLADVPPDSLEALRFKFRDGTRLLHSQYPLGAIREMCMGQLDETIDISSGGAFLLVHRPWLEVKVTALSPAEYDFAEALRTKDFGTAAEMTLNSHPGFDLPATFRRLMGLEIFLRE